MLRADIKKSNGLVKAEMSLDQHQPNIANTN